jgi:hypothetical protein
MKDQNGTALTQYSPDCVIRDRSAYGLTRMDGPPRFWKTNPLSQRGEFWKFRLSRFTNRKNILMADNLCQAWVNTPAAIRGRRQRVQGRAATVHQET